MSVPENWSPGSLGDVISSIRGGYSVKCEDRQAIAGEKAVLKTGAVLHGQFDPSQNKYVPPSEHDALRASVKAGTIIFCRKNSEETIGAAALIFEDFPNVFLSDLLWELHPAPNVDKHWLISTLHSELVRKRIQISATGTQSTMKNISQDRLLGIPLPIPPRSEQRKIAAILRAWNEALDKLTSLRANRADQFVGLTQKLLGHGGRFPARWPLQHLSDIATRTRRQNDGGSHPAMTISAKSGFLLQSDKFARDMAGSSADRYTLLHEGEFAYNKGNSKTAPYGCIYRLEQSTAVVPFVYFCFALKPGFDPVFYEHLFASGALNHQLSKLINSGVRNDGLLNLNVDDFFGCRVPVPENGEQRRIANVLSAARKEISLLDEEIDALTRQKRGLMQKLLTGKWRVNLEEKLA